MVQYLTSPGCLYRKFPDSWIGSGDPVPDPLVLQILFLGTYSSGELQKISFIPKECKM
jgi:hypothetical protein